MDAAAKIKANAEAEADALLDAFAPPRLCGPVATIAGDRAPLLERGNTQALGAAQIPPMPGKHESTSSDAAAGRRPVLSGHRLRPPAHPHTVDPQSAWQADAHARLVALQAQAAQTRQDNKEQWVRLCSALDALSTEVEDHHGTQTSHAHGGADSHGASAAERCAGANPLLRPWYTSRTNSYMVSGAAMGQANKDVLQLGGSTAGNFSHFADTKSVAGKSMAGKSTAGKSIRPAPSVQLSYTSYADMEDPDDHAENVSVAKSRKNDLLYHFDEEAQHVLELIYLDKDKTFGFEEKKKKKKKNGLMDKVMAAIDDMLLPPAMRPQYEKEQAALKKEREEEERLKKLQKERDWKRAGGLVADDDEEKSAAARLMKMKKALGEGSGERIPFEAVPVHGYREQGRSGCVPQRNVEYFRELKFKYEGGRFNSQRDGWGTQVYNDEYAYEGDWLLNLRQGFGSLDYPDGSLYEGQFYESMQHGFGVLKGTDGKHYKGAWERGKKHGFGEMPDRKKGLIFSGQWLAGKRHGFGIQLDVKTGAVYSGQWEYGLKHGAGVMKEWNASAGAIRTQMWWEKGKLVKKAPYDALTHGTEIGETAMWAAHYSKECAMDAELTVAQKIMYPEHPVRPKKAVDYVVQQAQEEAARIQAEEQAHRVEDPKVEVEKLKVPAVEFRRIISLVHSADKILEELVLPILDDAHPVAETETEGEHFLVGPIWDENLHKMCHHFAIKIQRQWRRTGMKRMIKVAREEGAEAKETDEQRGERLMRQVQEQRRKEQTAILKEMEMESKPFRDLQEACDLAVVEHDNKAPSRLLQKTRQLFRLEHMTAPFDETYSRKLTSVRLVHRLNAMKRKGGMWNVGRKQIGALSVLNLFKKRGDAKKDDEKDDTEALQRAVSSVLPEGSFIKAKAEVRDQQEQEALLQEDHHEQMDLDYNTVKYTDGSRYFGELYDGLPHGSGASMNPDGSTYFGQHMHGLRHGLGIYAIGLDEGADMRRLYAGEFLKGKRHGFAIERVMWKDKVCKSCVVTEYHGDVKLDSEVVRPEDHMEWLAACDKAAAEGKAAKVEAETLLDAENKDHTFKATQQIEFDWRVGLSTYTGDYNAVGQRHGLGAQTWHDGREFAGQFAKDLPNGGGREAYPDRSYYIGYFKDGQRHGWGKYHATNGIIYLGQWQDGLRHGFGIEREEKKGLVLWMAYVKYVQNSMQLLESVNPVQAKTWLDEAEASIRMAARTASESAPPTRIDYPEVNSENALVYIGGILDQQRAGVGVLTHKNGCRYIGEFMADKKHGMGVEEYADSSYYKGQFYYGCRHGWGEYYDATSGRMYRGGWMNGSRHGHGWERAVLKMISADIFKEFLIEYEMDKETSRRFITKQAKLEFVDEVLEMVKRAEDIQELTIEVYEGMLD